MAANTKESIVSIYIKIFFIVFNIKLKFNCKYLVFCNYIMLFLFNYNCNAPFNLIYKIKGSVTKDNVKSVVLEFKTQLLTNPRHTTMPKRKPVNKLTKKVCRSKNKQVHGP